MKYTKGEWKVSRVRALDNYAVKAEADIGGLGIAMVNYRIDRNEQLANAHLIAASPMMYEALQMVLRMSEEEYINRFLLSAVRQALAKAEGN